MINVNRGVVLIGWELWIFWYSILLWVKDSPLLMLIVVLISYVENYESFGILYESVSEALPCWYNCCSRILRNMIHLGFCGFYNWFITYPPMVETWEFDIVYGIDVTWFIQMMDMGWMWIYDMDITWFIQDEYKNYYECLIWVYICPCYCYIWLS